MKASADAKFALLRRERSLALPLAAAATPRAQALRPNIMVLFDTSGSMLYNQANDGSPLCNDNAATGRPAASTT